MKTLLYLDTNLCQTIACNSSNHMQQRNHNEVSNNLVFLSNWELHIQPNKASKPHENRTESDKYNPGSLVYLNHLMHIWWGYERGPSKDTSGVKMGIC